MDKAIFEYFKYYNFDVGPRLTALRSTRELAIDRGDFPELVPVLDAAIVADEELFALERRWQQRKRHKVRHGERATELDQKLDRLLASLEGGLSAQAGLKEFAGEKGALAERAWKTLFPGGLGALTKGSFGDQAHATRLILKTIDESPEIGQLIKDVNLDECVALIRQLNEEYSREISKARPPRFEELEAARLEGHKRLGCVLLKILARFPTDEDQDLANRRALLEAIEIQNDAMGAIYRQRVKPRDDKAPDVDQDAAPNPAGAQTDAA